MPAKTDPRKPPLPPGEIVRRIEKALAIDGTHTWEDVRQELIAGTAQIFWSEHGAWITQLWPAPRKKVLNVWVVAGELPEVMEIQEQVERFAADNDVDMMTVRGARFGWKHVARQHGWTEQSVVLTHPVNREQKKNG
jgi:hypothetical protein